jgi:hypothetical protein
MIDETPNTFRGRRGTHKDFFLEGKSDGRMPFKITRYREKDNNQMGNKKTVCEQMVWIELGLIRVEWRTYCVTITDNNTLTNNCILNNILGFF